MSTLTKTEEHPEKKVSILLSVHNDAKTIERCLESIYNQTFQDIALVIVDDFSTDTTVDIIEQVSKRFSHIPCTLLTNKTNIGLTQSLNRGLEIIHSLYTARIDADDWWEPTKLAKQVAFLDAHTDYGIVGTNYINHTETIEKKVTRPETHAEIDRSLFWRNPFAHSSVCYRTHLIQSVGSYNPSVRYAQDYELWVRCFPRTKFYNLQEFLCHRTLGSGISVDHQNAQMKLYLKVLFTYLPKYHRPWREYGAIFEPLLVLILPTWLKKLKRRYLS